MRDHSRWLTRAAIGLAVLWSSAAVEGQGYSRGLTQGEGLVKTIKPNGVTPRMADGKPDLSGMYTAGHHMFNWGLGWLLPRPDYTGPKCENCAGEPAQAVTDRAHINKPVYKPEYWQKVQDLDYGLVTDDPQFHCVLPQGVPRMGIPIKVIQTSREVVFWNMGYPVGYRTRTIPLDGRAFTQADRDSLTHDGISSGHWEGDTLVIQSVGFDDKTWLGWTGYIHSNEMTVTERLWRVGDLLYYQPTVTDPIMLQEPWVMDTEVRRINPDPNDFVLEESLPCEEHDRELLLKVSPNYRG